MDHEKYILDPLVIQFKNYYQYKYDISGYWPIMDAEVIKLFPDYICDILISADMKKKLLQSDTIDLGEADKSCYSVRMKEFKDDILITQFDTKTSEIIEYERPLYKKEARFIPSYRQGEIVFPKPKKPREIMRDVIKRSHKR